MGDPLQPQKILSEQAHQRAEGREDQIKKYAENDGVRDLVQQRSKGRPDAVQRR
jgi:hypothetical protein